MSRSSLTASLAAYFRQRPGVWIDGRVLATIGGAYAWRSRVSDLRRLPWRYDIRNRQRLILPAVGDPYKVSEYQLAPQRRDAAPRRTDYRCADAGSVLFLFQLMDQAPIAQMCHAGLAQ